MNAIIRNLKPKNVQLEIRFDDCEMFSTWQDPHGRLVSEFRKTYIAIHQRDVKGERLRRKICFEDGFINKMNNRRYNRIRDGRVVEVYPTEWNSKHTGFRIVLAYLIDLLDPEIRISVDLQKYYSIDRVMRIIKIWSGKIVSVQFYTTTVNEVEWRSLIRKSPVKDVVSFNVSKEVKSLAGSYHFIQLCRASTLRIEDLSKINSVALELKRVLFSDLEIQSFLKSLGRGKNPTLEYISFQMRGKVNLDAIVEGFEVVRRITDRKLKNCKVNVKCRSGVTIKLSNGYVCTVELDKILYRTVYSRRKITGFYDDLLKIFIWK